MFTRIVVGLDGSEQSDRALGVACDLAQKYGSEIHLVHTPKAETVAFALGAVAGYHAATTMPAPEKVKEAAEKVLASAQENVVGQDLAAEQLHIGATDPADDLVACAEACGADLIVTGRRGLGAVAGTLLGSTSQKISHDAKCAHLTVA
ncbi:universal stress protein [uncultured Roseobacter sp.]|uniref:universal stress protein n=1 Tax=uncultured Roseobacter sp. TaxID=114847 RepID=UPI002608B47F|nr:universal stress protein [uncultured Roseobacter sp.]